MAESAAHQRFAGKRAMVTGGTRGIGAACAAQLLQGGATVAVVGRDMQRGAEVVSRWPVAGHVIEADLSTPHGVERAASDAERLLGDIDILINAAGGSKMKSSARVGAADVTAMFGVNAEAVLLLSVRVGRNMVSRRAGSIVTVTSVAAHASAPFQVAYAASKAAAAAVSRSLAAEWAPYGVRVNAVAPGLIRTELTQAAWATPDDEERSASNVPVGRLGTPEEVAAAVVFLASDEASYITGQTLIVDGGMSGYYDLTTSGSSPPRPRGTVPPGSNSSG